MSITDLFAVFRLIGLLRNGIPQAVTIHNTLSTTVCTSVDTFAIGQALLVRVGGCTKTINIATSLTNKCRNFHSIVSLWSHFEKNTTITNPFLRCHIH